MLVGQTIQLKNLDATTDIAVASTAVVYSQVFKATRAEFFGLWVKAASTPDLKIEIEQGPIVPTDRASDTNWVVQDAGNTVVANLTATTSKIYSITMTPLEYFRLKVTGNAGNGAGATFAAYMFIQDHV